MGVLLELAAVPLALAADRVIEDFLSPVSFIFAVVGADLARYRNPHRVPAAENWAADRLDAIGGELEIKSSPGSVTTVRGRIPVV